MSVPIIASIVLNKIFCPSQPTVLNARVTPTEEPFAVIVFSMVASMKDVLLAFRSTSPTVVVTSLLLTWAFA